MTKQTENLNLSLFDFATDTLEEFVEGVASPNNSNMQKIDEAIAERIKLNGESVQNLDFVINDDSVITSIKIKDNNNIDKELILPSRTDHVRTPIGISTEDRYTKLLKTMSREFTSNGEDIVVDNAIPKQKVVSAKIEGQTVKNYAVDVSSVIQSSTTLSKGIEWRTQGLVGGNRYDVILNISKNTHKANLYVNNKANVKSAFVEYFAIEAGGTGTFKTTLTAREGVGVDFHNMCGVIIKHEEVGEIVIDSLVIVDANNSADSINGFLDFGLNSTRATITNNEEKHSFYNPIIEGKTVVMKAPKGTEEWVEINLEEPRDKKLYDYKLEHRNGLKSVPFGYDYVDLARKVKVIQIEEMTLNGSEAWTYCSGIPNSFGLTYQNVDLGKIVALKENMGCTVLSKDYHSICGNHGHDRKRTGITITDGRYVRLMFDPLNSEFTTSMTFTAWLKENPITLYYLLAEPKEIPLTEEEYEQYLNCREVIELNKIDDVSDSIETLDDGSGIYTKRIMSKRLLSCEFLYEQPAVDNDESMCFLLYTLQNSSAKKNGKWLPNILEKGLASSVSTTGSVISFVNKFFYVRLRRDEMKTQDINGLGQWLMDNELCVKYELEEPIVTKIPKELMPTIATYETNNFSFGEELKPSKSIIKMPIDKVSDLESEIEQLEKVITSTSNLSLLSNYVEDEYNKEINQL